MTSRTPLVVVDGDLQQQPVGDELLLRGNLNVDTYIVTAAGDLVLMPSGNSALLGSNTGNTRSIYSTDFQRSRTANSQVASGNYATIAGGQDNTASESNTSVGGGYSNDVSGVYSTIAGGYNNTANGAYSTVLGGHNNVASGIHSSIIGGYTSTASGNYSTVFGKYAYTTMHGEVAQCGGRIGIDGDAQTMTLTAARNDGSGNLVPLYLDADGTGPGTKQLLVPANSAWALKALVCGLATDGSKMAAYEWQAGVRRDGTATATFIGTPIRTIISEDDTTWDTSMTMNTTTNAVEINVKTVAGWYANWCARIEITQVKVSS